MIDRNACTNRDRQDPLRSLRDRFDLPDGLVYLDGNSLGPLPHAVRERLRDVVDQQWGHDLIRSWNVHGWIDLPLRVGEKIAPLIGAAPGQVAVADSTSVDLFKLLAGALELRPDRHVIVSERDNFPTDLYVADGLGRLRAGTDGGLRLRTIERGDVAGLDGVLGAADGARGAGDEVAVVMLTHVDYRTGELHDMAAVTERVHAAGALMLWDLSHSTGALELDLDGAGVDLAVGCGYKYLNGGPGAPAFLYVAHRHQEAIRSPIQGWLGHAEPFAFSADYRPAPGVARFLCGTPPILSLAALDAALDLFAEVELAALRAKSVALGQLFLDLVEQECGAWLGDDGGLAIACPRDGTRRGSQVSLRHPEGYAIIQALIARGVIGDFRTPDVLRFGLAPLYLRFADVWDAVAHLRKVLAEEEWRRPEHRQRSAVT